MRNAVTDTATGYVKRYGNTDFSTHGGWSPGTETQTQINDGATPPVGVPLYHVKLVTGSPFSDFAEMTTPEKDAVDAVRPVSLIQRKTRMALQTINSFPAWVSVFATPWVNELYPLTAGDWVFDCVFGVKLDSASVWGAAGPDVAVQARLVLNGSPVEGAAWIHPFDTFQGFSFSGSKSFAEGALPDIDLQIRSVPSAVDVSVQGVRIELRPLNVGIEVSE